MASTATLTVSLLVILSALGTLFVPAESSPIERRQLPCDHPLRVAAPGLFSHCTTSCTYGDWGEWQVVPNSLTSTRSCASGYAFSERRTRTVFGSRCTGATTETRSVCKPDREDSLIIALGLGSHSNSAPDLLVIPDSPNAILVPKNPVSLCEQSANSNQLSPDCEPSLRHRRSYCPSSGAGNICHNIVGKRSISESDSEDSVTKRDVSIATVNSLEATESPIPFDWSEHASHLHHRREARCTAGNTQHVLFVLDSSGSIGPTHYNVMKGALANLTSLFCKEVHFGLLTFSSQLHLDFCFNCFSSDYAGRAQAAQAILAAPYQNGGTYTGAAAKCICDRLLDPSCGISIDPNCLDVVFITDGWSNDPQLEVCDEIRCLHGKYGVNTYAIGIRNYNEAERSCISDNSDVLSAFDYEDFDDFRNSINEIIRRLLASNGQYTCADTSGTLRG